MSRKFTGEFFIGLFILLSALGISGYFYKEYRFDSNSSYTVRVAFSNVTGLKIGDPLVLSGVTVGQVTKIELNNKYIVNVHASIDKKVQLLDDTVAQITNYGIFGPMYIKLSPGGAGVPLKDGGYLANSIDARDFGSLIDSLILRFLK